MDFPRLKSRLSLSPQQILNNPYFYLFLFILIWIFCFRDFIFGQVLFDSDAGAYFQHIKFYIESLMRGIYPMWNPASDNQAPTEFFLRRFDSFNPVFLFLVIFKIFGISFELGYRLFLALYYLFAMIGFYLLSRRIFKNDLAAFAACLLLTFSSLGTRIIDSYVIFMFAAMVWFFYFLVSFTQDPQKKSLLGTTFCLMILMTTYVPFYFLIILTTFILTFLIVYFKEFKSILYRYIGFIKNNKLFTAVCVLVLILSLIVPILFYLESGRGEFELPMRGVNVDTETPGANVLMVSLSTVAGWGIIEDLMFSSFYMFSQLPYIQKAIFYVPLFIYIVLLCGVITKMNRKLLLLAIWGIGLLIINLPYGTPVYSFLYDHVSIFRYFRNLHFFLWIILLPIFILFAVEQFRLFWALTPKTKQEKIGLGIFLLLVHIGAAAVLYINGSRNWTSYVVIIFSLILFCIHFFTREGMRNSMVLIPVLLGLVIVLEPMQVYSYYMKNSESWSWAYGPEAAAISKKKEIEGKNINASVAGPAIPSIYYGVKWRNQLMQNISIGVLDRYKGTFLAYDQLEVIPDRLSDFGEVGRVLSERKNLALVSTDGRKLSFPDDFGKNVPPSREILDESANCKVLDFNANSIKFKINFPYTRFFVYNDSYHSDWRVFINGKRTELWRANVAFKGVFVPAGENIVEFKFGRPAKYWFNIFMLTVFYSVFGNLLWLHLRKDQV